MTHKLYRSRHGKFLGVCQGISDWKDFPVKYVRWAFILAAIFTSVVPVLIAYGIMAFFLDPAPRDNQFQGSESFNDEKDSYSRFKSRFNTMKDEFTNKEKDWENRFKDSE
jgi:phage shock protein C